MHIIYSLTNTVNGHVYIGKTSQSFAMRQADHLKGLRGGYHDNGHLGKAWMLYGESGFEWAILATIKTVEEANSLEVKLIADYREAGVTLYNLRGGGDGGPHSDETKERIRQGQYSRPADSDVTREKRRLAQTGRKASDATRLKMSEQRKGKPKPPFSAEHRQKIGENSSRRGCSEETARKISTSCKGRPKSEEWKAKMRSIRASKYWCSRKKPTE